MSVLPRVKECELALSPIPAGPVPARWGIGIDVCDRWARKEPGSPAAILHVRPDGREGKITYGWLRETSNRLANVLRAHRIERGDRVAILLPQSPEVAASHIGIYKLGGVALPLAVLFGTDALSYRLQNSGGGRADHQWARGWNGLPRSGNGLPRHSSSYSHSMAPAKAPLGNAKELARAAPNFAAVDTSAE